MRRQVWVVVVLALAVTVAAAQSAPALKERGAPSGHPPAAAQAVEGFSTLPSSASGEYQMSRDGSSVVQMTLDEGKLTGYVTKLDNGVTLTLFFTHTTLSGSRVSFLTATIHALHYEFRGMIVRGNAPDPSDPGYFVLTGELTEVRGKEKFTRQVNMPSTPRMS